MSQVHDARSRVAAIVAAAIRGPWLAFEEMAASPSVQTFCGFEMRFADGRLSVGDPLSLIRFQPDSEVYEAGRASLLLSHAHRRADSIARGLVTAYCVQKGRAVPDESDVDGTWDVLARVLKGGTTSLEEYLALSADLPEEELRLVHTHVLDRLGTSLLMIAARARASELYTLTDDASIVGTAAPREEIDATIDEALREACERIRAGRKYAAPRDASPAERAFAGCINVLRTMYALGSDRVVQRQLFDSPLLDQVAPHVPRGGFTTERKWGEARQRAAFNALALHMNGLIGTTYRYPGPEALDKWITARETAARAHDATDRLIAAYVLIARIAATRHFVDRIADGSLRCSEIMRAVMQLTMLPLQGRPVAGQLEEMLEWEVLPADVFGPREKPYAPPGSGSSVPLDWDRIDALRALAEGWDGAYLVRGVRALAGSAFKTEYYVLVLPDKVTGREHAVADSPIKDRGLYVFRAEQGDRFAPALTWREVFSQPRGWPVKWLGALCLLHVPTLAHNLLDALTCPPDEIEQRRLHRLNRSARATAAA